VNANSYPDAVDPSLVGTYSPLAKAGGGYAEALAFSQRTQGAKAPLALIRQLEYIAEDNPDEYRHVKDVRIAERPVEFLRRPRRTQNTISDFLAPNAPANRLDILRGLANQK
jgi:hypothetical protein